MRRFVIILPGEKCLIPPWRGNPLTNLIICNTIQTTIMPSTRSKGNLCLRERIFSLRKRIFCLIRPKCWDAATQVNLGALGRLLANSLSIAKSWSSDKTTILKPHNKYILYVEWRASQRLFAWRDKICVTVGTCPERVGGFGYNTDFLMRRSVRSDIDSIRKL